MSEGKKKSVRYLEISDRVQKLHRNLLAFSMVAIVYRVFDLRFTKLTAAGLEITNFNTSVLSAVLLLIIVYHVFAYSSVLFEEFAHWRITFMDQAAVFWGGGQRDVPLLQSINSKLESLERQGSEMERQAAELREWVKEYRRHFSSFSRGAMVRFVVLEVIIPAAGAGFAIVALISDVDLSPVRDFLLGTKGSTIRLTPSLV